MHRPLGHAVALLALLIISIAFVGAPSAGATGARTHCVVSVVGQRPSGEFLTSQPVCYDSFAAAMHAAGVDTSGLAVVSPSALAASNRLQSATSSIIGIHYDGANWTGASFSVNGSDCSGGWLNVAPAWNDRISSTSNGCPRIRHFWDANLVGTFQDTTGLGGNLSTLNNQTTSIQYLS
jgi:hypothetical protein